MLQVWVTHAHCRDAPKPTYFGASNLHAGLYMHALGERASKIKPSPRTAGRAWASDQEPTKLAYMF
jgi:hypothetical protein